MKKNGFTLVELIATLALIAIIATVILINMTGIKSNQDEVSATRFVSNIEEAGCTYIDMSIRQTDRNTCKESSIYSNVDTLSIDDPSIPAVCKVSLATLIEEGLVEGDKKDLETNLTAKDEEDKVYVLIHFVEETVDGNADKGKKCKFYRKP